MASMTRCIVCKKCKFPELKCEIYAMVYRMML